MIVGVLTAHLSMQGITSLKGKRSIIKSLIGRLKSRFNISISEVDHQDSKTSAVIGISIVSNDTHFIDQQFDAIIILCATMADSISAKSSGKPSRKISVL